LTKHQKDLTNHQINVMLSMLDLESVFNKEENMKVNRTNRISPVRKRNYAVIYTSLCLLQNIKRKLGLEAMLEFQEAYIKKLENINPEFKGAFGRAMELVKIEDLYEGTVCDEKDKDSID
jgi:hypothetical protein